jgi:hypothetical protein
MPESAKNCLSYVLALDKQVYCHKAEHVHCRQCIELRAERELIRITNGGSASFEIQTLPWAIIGANGEWLILTEAEAARIQEELNDLNLPEDALTRQQVLADFYASKGLVLHTLYSMGEIATIDPEQVIIPDSIEVPDLSDFLNDVRDVPVPMQDSTVDPDAVELFNRINDELSELRITLADDRFRRDLSYAVQLQHYGLPVDARLALQNALEALGEQLSTQ